MHASIYFLMRNRCDNLILVFIDFITILFSVNLDPFCTGVLECCWPFFSMSVSLIQQTNTSWCNQYHARNAWYFNDFSKKNSSVPYFILKIAYASLVLGFVCPFCLLYFYCKPVQNTVFLQSFFLFYHFICSTMLCFFFSRQMWSHRVLWTISVFF